MTLVIGGVTNKALKKKLYEFVSLATFRIFGRALSGEHRFPNPSPSEHKEAGTIDRKMNIFLKF
jgi:hypothetical protein